MANVALSSIRGGVRIGEYKEFSPLTTDPQIVEHYGQAFLGPGYSVPVSQTNNVSGALNPFLIEAFENHTTNFIGRIASDTNSIIHDGVNFFHTNANQKCLMRSTDGAQTWSSVLVTDQAFGRIYFVNGRYFLMEGNGFRFSENAVDWSRVVLPTTAALRTIAFGNGVYVVGGTSGAIFSSEDPTKGWTARSAGSATFIKILFENGIFVAATSVGNGVWTSPDGITWTNRTLPGTAIPLSLVWTGTNFVIGSNQTTTNILTSPDGITWTARTNTIATLRTIQNCLAYANGVLVSIGTSNDQVSISLDHGVTWQNRSFTSSIPFGAVYSAANTFYLITSSASPRLSTYTSTDGTTWYHRNHPTDFAPSANASITVFGNNVIYTGVTQGRVFVANLNQTPLQWAMTNTAPTGQTASWFVSDIATNGSFLVAGGSSGNIQTSSDGINWTNRVLGSANSVIALEYANHTWVAVGSGGLLASSTDTITWTTHPSNSTQQFNDVAFGNGVFVAVGGSGNARISSDGTTWSNVSLGTAATMNRIAWANDVFVAVGSSANVLTSPDGTNWTSRSLGGTTMNATGLSVLANGLVLVMGNGSGLQTQSNSSAIFTSSDKINWTEDTSHVYFNAITLSPYIDIKSLPNGSLMAIGATIMPFVGANTRTLSYTYSDGLAGDVRKVAYNKNDGSFWALTTGGNLGEVVFRSTDRGVSWKLVRAVPRGARGGASSDLIVTSNGVVVVDSSLGVISRSANNGNDAWSTTTIIGAGASYALAEGRDRIVVVTGTGANVDIFSSFDAGLSFVQSNSLNISDTSPARTVATYSPELDTFYFGGPPDISNRNINTFAAKTGSLGVLTLGQVVSTVVSLEWKNNTLFARYIEQPRIFYWPSGANLFSNTFTINAVVGTNTLVITDTGIYSRYNTFAAKTTTGNVFLSAQTQSTNTFFDAPIMTHSNAIGFGNGAVVTFHTGSGSVPFVSTSNSSVLNYNSPVNTAINTPYLRIK